MQFTTLAKSQLSDKELDWLNGKIELISINETSKKFNVFFSLVSRFIENTPCEFNSSEIEALEKIYPGFQKTTWTKQDVVRVLLMMSLDKSVNKEILLSFFENAEIKEQIALYKGLFLLENASDFKDQVTEGIRTNIVTIFEAITHGNPFVKTYLNEDAWNQLILKTFFVDSKIYKIQYIDEGKNENLANMLQDYIKERWAAGRKVPLEIWRMVDGYLLDDIKKMIADKNFESTEGEILRTIIKQPKLLSPAYWNSIGQKN